MGTTATVLAALAKRPATVAELAQRLGRHTSTLYVTLERRRLSGHVTREKVGREYLYHLTAYGRKNLDWWKGQP